MRFTMKPGVDRARTVCLPHAFAVASSVARVSGDVVSPQTISTNGISGAGLKKCMPPRRSGRRSPAAIAVIESEEVLLAKTASVAATSSSIRNNPRLASRSSTMASTTRPQRPNSSTEAAGRSLVQVSTPCSALRRPLTTNFPTPSEIA